MFSTKDVIASHIRQFMARNIEGILDDFAPDAILFTPTGPLKGRNEIKKLFVSLLADFGRPGTSITTQTETFEGDFAYTVWKGETPDNFYEIATDTFFVQDGKIKVQSFAAKVNPKRQ